MTARDSLVSSAWVLSLLQHQLDQLDRMIAEDLVCGERDTANNNRLIRFGIAAAFTELETSFGYLELKP